MIVLQASASIDWYFIGINSLISLIVGLIGVYVGYLLAKCKDEEQKVHEKDEKIQLAKQILSNELKGLKGEVDGYYKTKEENEGKFGKGGVFQPNIDLPTDCKDSIVNTGYFILLTRNLQYKISHIYSIVERAKFLIPGIHDIHIKYLENKGKEDTQKELATAMGKQSEKLEMQLKLLKTEIEGIESELPNPETN